MIINRLYKKVLLSVLLLIKKQKWRRKNKHNNTFIVNDFDIESVVVGKYSYGDLRVLRYGRQGKLKIGNFCSIAPNVTFILDADHNSKLLSTYPFMRYIQGIDERDAITKGDISIGDDVWIGYNSIILSGVSIGQGAVVGAGSIVTKDVEPYSIVAGNPAKVVKYRFSNNDIKRLKLFDYSKLDKNIIVNHLDSLYLEYKNDDIYEWFPRKQ